MREAPDQQERARAIAARGKTVLVNAGAGAGKTTLLVSRLLSLVAPEDDGPALLLSKIAAVTFTRRAAGELRLRVRERILETISSPALSKTRRERLLAALGSVDTAFLGTVHGFADRLLRLLPMKARLSPVYEIVDDLEPLALETFQRVLHGVQNGTLAAELEGETPETVAEVERTFHEALRAGLRPYSEDTGVWVRVGLDALVRGFVEHRDRELRWEGDGAFDRKAFDAAALELARLVEPLDCDMEGTAWLRTLVKKVKEAQGERDPIDAYGLVRFVKAGRERYTQTKHFSKGAARTAWKRFDGGKEDGVQVDGLADALVAPLKSMLARRLARTRGPIVRLYERVKTRAQVLDHVDLLLVLRDLLRDDLEARAFYQGLFDHVLVDEVQDTDPLQAEILLYLTEKTPRARAFRDIEVDPGRLTLVGDPKQSIYRFRRADVAMVAEIQKQLERGPHETVTLSANFRSVPSLLDWVNAQFAKILGTGPKGAIFDEATGTVFHQPLVPGLREPRGPAVIELAYGEEAKDGEKDRKADEGRDVEASAIAAFLRRMVSERARTVRDPDTGERRPIGYGDIAVLARVTTNVPKLFRAFDAEDVPYAMAGGTLFLSDALHQQLFLALRALADRNDGVAEAALLRPPFFGVDLLDVLHDKARADTPEAARAQAARAWLKDARRKRFERSSGATARALLEETGLGRAVALGPNGAERLALVRELILQLELVAMREGLDYDGVTARMRAWIEHAPQMDPPRPVGRGVVQVLSVHQAKGLEFPVVVLWDGMGDWTAREQRKPWSVDRAGNGWAVDVDGLSHEEPAGRDMLEREKRLAEAEKKRIVYVGATRAKDWLVVPVPAWANGRNGRKYVHAALVAEPPEGTVERVSARGLARKDAEGEDRAVVGAVKVAGEREERERQARWAAAWGESKKARLAPASVTGVAKGGAAAADARAERVADASGAGAEAAADGEVVMRVGDGEVERPVKVRRAGRFGALFGETVHRAIGMVIARGVAPREAVERAAKGTGLVENVGEAEEDVKRAVGVLEREGIVGDGRIVRLEYPVGEVRGGADRGEIVAGYVDLVSTAKDGSDVVLVDFKTDAWVGGGADVEENYPAYVRQVRAYGGMVGAGRVGLLFTARDGIAWVTGEHSGSG